MNPLEQDDGIQDCAANRVTGCRLDGQGVGVRVPTSQEFSLPYVIQTGSVAYPMGTRVSFPAAKVAGA
jgi:hypothetical protein